MRPPQDEHISFDELLENAVDHIDAIQVLRHKLGADKNVQVTVHLSAWALNVILEGWEDSLKRRMSP